MLLSSDMRALQDRLGAVQNENVLIADVDDVYQNLWLSYLARHNRVWITSPIIEETWRGISSQIADTNDPRRLPAPLYIVSENADERLSYGLTARELVWSGSQLHLWHVTSPDWIVASRIEGRGSRSTTRRRPRSSSEPGETIIRAVLPRPGMLRLAVTLVPGPSAPPARSEARVATDDGFTPEWRSNVGDPAWSSRPRGMTTISLTPSMGVWRVRPRLTALGVPESRGARNAPELEGAPAGSR
jgi:hypothetical protein